MLEKLLNQFYLGDAHYTNKYFYTRELYEGVRNKEAFMLDVKKRLAFQMAEHIIAREKRCYSEGIRDNGLNDSFEVKVELMIMPMSDFKACIEACIQTMPMHIIEEIRAKGMPTMNK